MTEPEPDDSLSEYERLRLTKIARNNAYLESLGLAKKTIVNSMKKSNNIRKKRKIDNEKKALGPRRASKRIKDAVLRERSNDQLLDPEVEKAKSWMIEHSFDPEIRTHKKRSTKENEDQRTKKSSRKETVIVLRAESLSIDDLRDYEKEAFLALREWKRSRGKELGYSNPCVICHNRTLVEMCRLVPNDEESLLGVWGINESRLEKHGKLMLEALKPWRKHLIEGHAEYNSNNENDYEDDDDTKPAQDWLNKKSRLGLPTCPWNEMRSWCSRTNNCPSCERHGPDGAWAIMSQRLLDILERNYGGRDAGWRWYPHKTKTAHHHKWWPPQSICDEEGLSYKDLPLGTMSVLELLYQRRTTA